MHADVRWIGKTAFAGRSGSNHWVTMDSTYDGGDGAAASPMEFLLLSLAGCTAVDVKAVLRKMRQRLDALEVAVEGTQADTTPKVFEAIHMVYVVRGRGLDPAKVEKAVRMSRDKLCSVSRMLEATVKISHEIRVEDTEEGGGA